MSELKKIIVGGPLYGLHNIGDEAILYSILKGLAGKADLSVLTYDSSWVDDEFEVKRIKIKTMFSKPVLGLTATPRKKIFMSIKESFFPDRSCFEGKDLFLCGGATILSDCPWHVLHLIELAASCNVPSVLWGVGMAEVNNKETLDYVRKVCNSNAVLHIFTRDAYVMQRLVNYGVRADKVSVSYDPAYIIDGSKFDPLMYMDKQEKNLYENKNSKICVSLSGEADVLEKTHVNEVKNMIEKVTADGNTNVYLVPTGCGEHCRDRELLRALKINDNVIYIEKEMAPQHIVEFLSNMDVVVSSRLHCSIFASITGVLSINLIRNTKQEDFAKLFDFPAIHMEETKCDDLLDLIKRAIEHKAEIKKRVKSQISEMRDIYAKAENELFEKYMKRK